MDHNTLLLKAISKESLKLGFNHAVYDRVKRDYFYDPIEINHALQHKDEIIDELEFELSQPENYQQRTSLCYFPPKTRLTFRRMIYIPIKDLCVRYSFIHTMAQYIDGRFIQNCFSNRLEGKNSNKYFLQDFSEISHPKWCIWQKENSEKEYILLKTDISSFYDSVSHEYLHEAISKELDIPLNSRFLKIFDKILKIPLISYSTKSKSLSNKTLLMQGLAIGNNCDGFLANVYLKDTDILMESVPNTIYGRYVDDIRIFAKKRTAALNAIKILQENLLTKGLNLNGAKTELAEDTSSKLRLVSKANPYHEDEENQSRRNKLSEKVDKRFYEFEEIFDPIPSFINNFEEKDSRAKDYCKFVSTKDEHDNFKLLKLEDRTIEHVFTLSSIIKKWQGASKHASWLLIETAFFNNVPRITREEAKKEILNLVSSKEVSSYGKYRILHHLVKNRGQRGSSFFDKLKSLEKQIIYKQISDYLVTPSIELNIISLVILSRRYRSAEKVKRYVKQKISKSNVNREIPHFMEADLFNLKSIEGFYESEFLMKTEKNTQNKKSVAKNNLSNKSIKISASM